MRENTKAIVCQPKAFQVLCGIVKYFIGSSDEITVPKINQLVSFWSHSGPVPLILPSYQVQSYQFCGELVSTNKELFSEINRPVSL